MLTEPNVLVVSADAAAKYQLNRPATSLSSSVIGTIGVGGGAINSTMDSNFKPKNYLTQRHLESFDQSKNEIVSPVLQNWFLMIDQIQNETLQRYQVWKAYLEVQAKNARQDEVFKNFASLEQHIPLASQRLHEICTNTISLEQEETIFRLKKN